MIESILEAVNYFATTAFVLLAAIGGAVSFVFKVNAFKVPL
jgi:hypothetical protein